MIIDGLEINDWSRAVVDEVRSGGVDIVHATVGVWEDLAGAMTRIGAFRHLCRHNADAVRVVTSVAEMHRAVADNVLGAVLGFQNSTMLGDDPEMAQIFADVGVRVVQLTYNIANHLGSSCWEPVDGGLTRAGRRMVAALNDAGVLIDLSHVRQRHEPRRGCMRRLSPPRSRTATRCGSATRPATSPMSCSTRWRGAAA